MHKESREDEKLLERIAWAITSIVGRDRIQLDLIELYPIFIIKLPNLLSEFHQYTLCVNNLNALYNYSLLAHAG